MKVQKIKFDPMAPIESGRRYTAAQVALILGIACGTLANLRCENRGPSFIKAAGKIQYLGEDIINYLEDRKTITRNVA